MKKHLIIWLTNCIFSSTALLASGYCWVDGVTDPTTTGPSRGECIYIEDPTPPSVHCNSHCIELTFPSYPTVHPAESGKSSYITNSPYPVTIKVTAYMCVFNAFQHECYCGFPEDRPDDTFDAIAYVTAGDPCPVPAPTPQE